MERGTMISYDVWMTSKLQAFKVGLGLKTPISTLFSFRIVYLINMTVPYRKRLTMIKKIMTRRVKE